jgi:Ca2+-binding RTX toxin-like protein
LTGTLVLDADGLATVSLDLAADQLTEGLESFSFIIFSNNVQVASVDVSINDTSVAPDASTPPVTDPLTGLVLWGSVGNSVVVGGSGDDSLAGVSETGLDPQYLGRGSVDTLTGGSGSDLFKLGDERGAFYLGSAAKDFAHITDYIAGEDKIQLSRNYDYVWSGQSGSLMLYVDSNGNGLVDGFAFSFFGASAFQSDDLVAQIDGLDAFNLADVVWV